SNGPPRSWLRNRNPPSNKGRCPAGTAVRPVRRCRRETKKKQLGNRGCMNIAVAIVLLVLTVFVIIVLVRSVRIIPQARAGVVERLGKYQRTLNPGLTLLIPFVDR